MIQLNGSLQNYAVNKKKELIRKYDTILDYAKGNEDVNKALVYFCYQKMLAGLDDVSRAHVDSDYLLKALSESIERDEMLLDSRILDDLGKIYDQGNWIDKVTYELYVHYLQSGIKFVGRYDSLDDAKKAYMRMDNKLDFFYVVEKRRNCNVEESLVVWNSN